MTPQLIKAKSKLLAQLVSSRSYRQLEFLAVGNFYVYNDASHATPGSSSPTGAEGGAGAGTPSRPTIDAVPATREAIFASPISPRAKRSLIKFLKYVMGLVDAATAATEDSDAAGTPPGLDSDSDGDMPFDEFLTTRFSLDPAVQSFVQALTLSPVPASRLRTKEALDRLVSYLASTGALGPGFAAVYPKWGGLAEVAQVACRAAAVGGAVYMLGTDSDAIDDEKAGTGDATAEADTVGLRLYPSGVIVRTKKIVRVSDEDTVPERDPAMGWPIERVCRLIAVIDSPLERFFEKTADVAPVPSVAVVALPPASVGEIQSAPVYAVLHSSDTGECPKGQSKSIKPP